MAKARDVFVRANEANRAVLEPLVNAHLTGYDAALQELEMTHRLVADETDLDLQSKTRPAATWLVLGRGLGLARAGFDLTASGYSGEVIPTLRSLHEATRLLGVLTLPGEDALVQRWLSGRSVSRGAVMAASGRQEEAGRVEMLKEGLTPPGKTRSYFEGQYGRWSEVAHHRRRHLLDQVSPPARMMAAGPHPDWRSRAAITDHFGWYVIELVSVGGSALAHLLGPAWFHDRFQPTFRGLLTLKARIPLTDLAKGKDGSSSER